MYAAVLSVHPGLAGGSRLRAWPHEGREAYVAEMAVLLGAGVLATVATAFFDFGLRIPGHAILRAVFPMSLGLALAPRRMGGLVMGLGAMGSALVLTAGGMAALGSGAMTSLLLTGPMLDLALWRPRHGWSLYVGFALAGLGSNLAALAVRAGAKLDRPGGRGRPAVRLVVAPGGRHLRAVRTAGRTRQRGGLVPIPARRSGPDASRETPR